MHQMTIPQTITMHVAIIMHVDRSISFELFIANVDDVDDVADVAV